MSNTAKIKSVRAKSGKEFVVIRWVDWWLPTSQQADRESWYMAEVSGDGQIEMVAPFYGQRSEAAAKAMLKRGGDAIEKWLADERQKSGGGDPLPKAKRRKVKVVEEGSVGPEGSKDKDKGEKLAALIGQKAREE